MDSRCLAKIMCCYLRSTLTVWWHRVGTLWLQLPTRSTSSGYYLKVADHFLMLCARNAKSPLMLGAAITYWTICQKKSQNLRRKMKVMMKRKNRWTRQRIKQIRPSMTRAKISICYRRTWSKGTHLHRKSSSCASKISWTKVPDMERRSRRVIFSTSSSTATSTVTMHCVCKQSSKTSTLTMNP